MKSALEIIRESVSDVPGWSPEDQLFALYMLAVSTSHLKGDIWEIGSWCGRSSIVLATALKNWDKGKVHCIDLFPARNDWYENQDGSYSFCVTIEGQTYHSYTEQTVWKEPYARDIVPMYQKYGNELESIFEGYLKKKGCAERVIKYRGIASNYAKKYVGNVKMAFVDGDHSFAGVCADIDAVERFLVPGGWIAFDDAFSSYDGVNRAIEERIIKSGKYESGQLLTRKCFAARRRSA